MPLLLPALKRVIHRCTSLWSAIATVTKVTVRAPSRAGHPPKGFPNSRADVGPPNASSEPYPSRPRCAYTSPPMPIDHSAPTHAVRVWKGAAPVPAGARNHGTGVRVTVDVMPDGRLLVSCWEGERFRAGYRVADKAEVLGKFLPQVIGEAIELALAGDATDGLALGHQEGRRP